MAKRGRMDVDVIRMRVRAAMGLATLRGFCKGIGLPESELPSVSRFLRGEVVGDDKVRLIARACGILPPPRKRLRRTMTYEEARLWDGMSWEERWERLVRPLPAAGLLAGEEHEGERDAKVGDDDQGDEVFQRHTVDVEEEVVHVTSLR